MSVKRQKPLYHNFRYDPRDLSRRLRVKCSPATRRVILTRTEADVVASRAGVSIGCTNSNCAVRMGKEAFGHEVIMADFSKTSVYIIDQLDKRGQPKHCVWYKHNDGASIDLNDHVVSRQELLEKLDMDKSILLQPPVIRLGQNNPPHRTPQAPRDEATPRRKAVAYGAMRRAREAGLLVLQA